jgi:hypothetical protein
MIVEHVAVSLCAPINWEIQGNVFEGTVRRLRVFGNCLYLGNDIR